MNTAHAGSVGTFGASLGNKALSFINKFGQPEYAYSLRNLTDGDPDLLSLENDQADSRIFKASEVNASEIESFADGGQVRVVRWYDQSSSSNDLLQGNESSQPVITDSSGNYLGAVRFDNINHVMLQTNTSTSVSQPLTIFTVHELIQLVGFNILWADSTQANFQYYSGLSFQTSMGGSVGGADRTVGVTDQFTTLVDASSSTMRVNGASYASGTLGNALVRLSLGQSFGVGNNIDVSEFVVYSGSENNDKIEQDQISHYTTA